MFIKITVDKPEAIDLLRTVSEDISKGYVAIQLAQSPIQESSAKEKNEYFKGIINGRLADATPNDLDKLTNEIHYRWQVLSKLFGDTSNAKIDIEFCQTIDDSIQDQNTIIIIPYGYATGIVMADPNDMA